MPKLHLRIVSPERTLLDENVDEVILPTVTGQIAVLPHHMPLVAELSHGDIIIRDDHKDKVTLVYGGFVYVKENGEVMILADGAEHFDELNEAEILKAKERAEAAKENAKEDEAMLAISEAELARIATQLRSLRRYSGPRKQHNKQTQDNL